MEPYSLLSPNLLLLLSKVDEAVKLVDAPLHTFSVPGLESNIVGFAGPVVYCSYLILLYIESSHCA